MTQCRTGHLDLLGGRAAVCYARPQVASQIRRRCPPGQDTATAASVWVMRPSRQRRNACRALHGFHALCIRALHGFHALCMSVPRHVGCDLSACLIYLLYLWPVCRLVRYLWHSFWAQCAASTAGKHPFGMRSGDALDLECFHSVSSPVLGLD